MSRKRKPPADAPPLAAITREQAGALLADAELRAECERLGVDLGLIVGNLLVPVDGRWKRHRRALRMALAFWEMGRQAGLHG
jgi:hypothetical protein